MDENKHDHGPDGGTPVPALASGKPVLASKTINSVLVLRDVVPLLLRDVLPALHTLSPIVGLWRQRKTVELEGRLGHFTESGTKTLQAWKSRLVDQTSFEQIQSVVEYWSMASEASKKLWRTSDIEKTIDIQHPDGSRITYYDGDSAPPVRIRKTIMPLTSCLPAATCEVTIDCVKRCHGIRIVAKVEDVLPMVNKGSFEPKFVRIKKRRTYVYMDRFMYCFTIVNAGDTVLIAETAAPTYEFEIELVNSLELWAEQSNMEIAALLLDKLRQLVGPPGELSIIHAT